jgi:hypothetical protein
VLVVKVLLQLRQSSAASSSERELVRARSLWVIRFSCSSLPASWLPARDPEFPQ